MMFFAALLLAVLVAFNDIAQAALYAMTDQIEVGQLRLLRDGLAIGLGAAGLASRWAPAGVRTPALLYLTIVAAYGVYGAAGDDPRLTISSGAQLIVPTLFFFAGLGCVPDRGKLAALLGTVCLIAVATTAFGAWDIRNTGFWTDVLAYGDYLYDVKAVSTGFHPEEFLPWNFFGFQENRRAAGLLAAPLAQGAYLAVAGALGYAYFRPRRPVAAHVFLALCAFGVYQSGTRGAMLILLIATPFYLLLSWSRLSGMVRNLALACVLVALPSETLLEIGAYTTALEDGSTIGHLNALELNLADIGAVALLGLGLGAAGALASQSGLEIAGGGEGALFTIAYQIGAPGVLAFLWFFAAAVLHLYRHRLGPDRHLFIAMTTTAAAATTSLVISEHLLMVSGMGTFWLLLGACVGVAVRQPRGDLADAPVSAGRTASCEPTDGQAAPGSAAAAESGATARRGDHPPSAAGVRARPPSVGESRSTAPDPAPPPAAGPADRRLAGR